MSIEISEIKAFDNPDIIEDCIRRDDSILYGMAKDMLGEKEKVLSIKIESPDSFGVGLYNLDTKENIITASPKYINSDIEDSKKINLLISNILHDVSSSNSINMQNFSEIESSVVEIIENNKLCVDSNVFIEDSILESFCDEDIVIQNDESVISLGSLFDDDIIHSKIDEPTMQDVKKATSWIFDMHSNEKENITEIANTATLPEPIDYDEPASLSL